MSEAKTVLAKLQKEHGEHVGMTGVVGTPTSVERIPTGIFPMDLALCGGFPKGKLSILYGPESSGKSTLALMAMGYVQRHMGMKAVLVDVEGSFDPDWAKHYGDAENVIRMSPDTAEQAVDIIEAFMYAKDVGIVVIDSIAALVTDNEIESDAGKQIVGGASLLVGKLIRKVVRAFNTEAKRDHRPTLLCVNQIRHKIGVMYGDPETTPGGNSIRFASSMTVRLSGKDRFDKAVSSKLPAWKTISGVVRKWKVPIVSRNFEAEICLVPHGPFHMGASPSWNTVANYLKQHGALVKNKQGWLLLGVQYKTLNEIQGIYEENPDVCLALQREVIDRERKSALADSDHPQIVVDTLTGEVLEA